MNADDDLWAAQRDASWYARPNVRSPKALHVAGQPCRLGYMSRCGRSLLDDTNRWALAEVPERIRCQSNGCRQAWAATSERTDRP